MIFRCNSCQSAIAVQADPVAGTAETTCRHCEQRYEFDVAQVCGAGLKRLGVKARELTVEHGIDLPSANSIALGVSELDRVLEIVAAGAPTSAPPTDADQQIEFDPEFAPSVEAGRLTPRQAMERGQRAVYCDRLRRRHKLSSKLAEAVADNRISLLKALRAREAQADAPVRVGRAGGVGRGASYAVVAGLVVLVGLGAAALWSRPAPEERYEAARSVSLDGGASYETDHSDRVLRVVGPDPGTVLQAFCRVGARRGRFEPAGMTPVSSPRGRARLGLLRDPSQPDALLAVTIFEDVDAGHWVLDNAGRPVAAEPAPDAAWRRVGKKNGRNSSSQTSDEAENVENAARKSPDRQE